MVAAEQRRQGGDVVRLAEPADRRLRQQLLEAAGVPTEGAGFVALGGTGAAAFVEQFKQLRIWERAPEVMAQP